MRWASVVIAVTLFIAVSDDVAGFEWPARHSAKVSGVVGEYRTNRFHNGTDIAYGDGTAIFHPLHSEFCVSYPNSNPPWVSIRTIKGGGEEDQVAAYLHLNALPGCKEPACIPMCESGDEITGILDEMPDDPNVPGDQSVPADAIGEVFGGAYGQHLHFILGVGNSGGTQGGEINALSYLDGYTDAAPPMMVYGWAEGGESVQLCPDVVQGDLDIWNCALPFMYN